MLYYVMRPDNVNHFDPVFTRYGRLSSDLDRTMKRAQRVNGKVYCTNGHGNELVANYWTAPQKPTTPRRTFAEHKRVMAEAALFGVQV